MNKTEIKKELMRCNEGRPFISITELAAALHTGRDSARNLVTGLEYIPQGKRKDYFVDDVAARISQRRRV